MYSSENSGFDIKDIIVKILFLVFFVLILMWLYPKFPSLDVLTDRVYNENITAMKEAAVDYYTTDRLPKNTGDVSEMTLQRMYDLKLIIPFVDKDGRSCDTNNSYVSVTKEADEYVMKVTLVCGNKNDYVIEHIGCHNVCTDCTANNNNTNNNTTKPSNNNSNGGSSVVTTTKYKVTVKATNGTVAKSSLTVKKGSNTSTTVKPNSGYTYSKVTCTNGQKATWSNNKITVKNVTKATTCTVKFVKSNVDPSVKYTVKVTVVNGNSDATTKTVSKNDNATFTIGANSGYNVNNSAVTCSNGTVASMASNKLTFKNVNQNGVCVVTLGKTSYSTYTVKVQVLNGKSDYTRKTVTHGSAAGFNITPNTNYTVTGATVTCGYGLTGTLTGNVLKVSNVKANGNCLVKLVKAPKYASVVKTYYSTGYVYKTGTYTYGVNLNSLPNHITPDKVVATGVSIQVMSTQADFNNYVAAKKASDMTQPNGENGWSVANGSAATLRAHALTSKNFTVSAKSGCSKKLCSVTITDKVNNLDGVTPDTNVTFVNGKQGTGLYYVPVKFIVTFKYEK